MRKALVLVALMGIGCSEKPVEEKMTVTYDTIIPKENSEKAARFIVQCAEAATPHSTGEDQRLPVDPCRRAALEVYGVVVRGKSYKPCSSCYPVFVPDAR